MHNFSIPSVAKLWIDQVVRGGRTFAYGAERSQGACLQAKKPPYSPRPGESTKRELRLAALNFIDPYLNTILGFIGVTDVRFVTASGTAQLMSGNVDRGQFLQPHLEQVRSIAV